MLNIETMTEKDTILLIRDLAGRLPYGVKGLVHVEGFTGEYDMYDGSATFDFYPENAELIGLDGDSGDVRVIYLNPGMMDADPSDYDYTIWDFTPYLRPMSSMTEEEKKRSRQEAKAMGDGRPEFHGGRVLGKFIGFIGTLILILAIVACLGLFVPHYAGIEQFVVRNGNMEPAISVGSMVYTAQTEPSTLEAGNIIVYKGGESDGSPVTSRVVENRLADGEVITKGDANPQNDPSPVKYTDILGKKVLSVPMLGYIAAPMATIFGKVAMSLVIIGAYILTVIGARLRRV